MLLDVYQCLLAETLTLAGRPHEALAAIEDGLRHIGDTGGFYAADLPTGDWFAHYADRFKTVELNAPFYSWPTTATVRAWLRQVGRRKFVYTIKASELITHVKRFTGTSPTYSARTWDVSCFNSRPASTSRKPAWTEFLPRWTRPGGTSWSSGTAVGGISGCMPPSVRVAPSSARAVGLGCQMSW